MEHRRVRKNRYKKKPEAEKEGFSLREVGRISLRMIWMMLICMVMSITFIFGHDLLTQCDYFNTEKILVRGASRLSDAEVLRTAKLELGVNSLSVNLNLVRKRLLAHPWVAQADVYRELPRTIVIDIEEEQPIAVLNLGRLFLINTRGNIFKAAAAGESKNLPVISGIDYTDWKTGEAGRTRVFSALMEVLLLGRSAIGVVPNSMIREIVVDREIGLTLKLDGSIKTVCLGFENYPVKYKRLARILDYRNQNEAIGVIESLDLRNPDRVVAHLLSKPESGNDKKEV